MNSIFRSMKQAAILLTIFHLVSVVVIAQTPSPPLVINKYSKLTSYPELSSYVELLGRKSGLMKTEIIGHSVQGRNLYAMKFSLSGFGKDTTKIKVLIFAQQHGNEQSGKEGALLLALELLRPVNRYLFNKIDLALIPQVNPDGSEVNQRRNANGMDLNRNHLILTEPETIALHQLFDRYLFEVTMDVHEYSPFGEEWKKYGYRKNTDLNIGTTTNLNVAESIRKLSDDDYLPFIFSYLHARNFSSFTYSPGGPPEIDYIRHSTFDINDGRQSFGIQGTFSFIQEGMNGKDDSIDNLQHRAEGQMAGMRGLLEYTYSNKGKIRTLISGERKKLLSADPGQKISVQSQHIANGQFLTIPLYSYYSHNDTLVTVKDYRPVVKSIYDVRKPSGYLIPKDNKDLVEWAERLSLEQIPLKKYPGEHFVQYRITSVDSADFEGDRVADPQLASDILKELPPDHGFIFIPTAQLKGILVVLALEPKSMLGLETYHRYAGLLKKGSPFPVLRVEK
ncbi:MAG: M14 family zinc carboxypeptidase [Bacteroidetes bacterium]|nr:M14 family zinc carboxypeptidase [Bacteroidota bacterium]